MHLPLFRPPMPGQGSRCEERGALPNCGPAAQAPREGSWRSHSNEVGARLTAQPPLEDALVIPSLWFPRLVLKLQILEACCSSKKV